MILFHVALMSTLEMILLLLSSLHICREYFLLGPLLAPSKLYAEFAKLMIYLPTSLEMLQSYEREEASSMGVCNRSAVSRHILIIIANAQSEQSAVLCSAC